MIKIKKITAHTIEVDGKQLSLNDSEKIVKTAGTDYYIHKNKKDSNFIISELKNLKMFKLIGGFHYGLIPEDFKAINNINEKSATKIAGINHYSIWDKKHKPKCNPEGMVFIPKLKIWVDIYLLNSEHKDNGTSKANTIIAAGDDYNSRKIPVDEKNLKGDVVDKIAKSHKKRSLTQKEFRKAMYGVKEGVSAEDKDDGTIKHIEDFTSRYGIEQATGVIWVWSKDKYNSQDNLRVLLGGTRVHGVNAGSRASHWNSFVWNSNWYIGCRFACDHL
ncbi:hypothetical protein [Sulfurimonas sp.]|uniref:phage major tropism determinant n=1 Tax=Sulfurimonas sp. TaxID=2022749 RepID=UPI0026013690|nr:hypothetical protein [Sulfurimonas sp.]